MAQSHVQVNTPSSVLISNSLHHEPHSTNNLLALKRLKYQKIITFPFVIYMYFYARILLICTYECHNSFVVHCAHVIYKHRKPHALLNQVM